MESGSEDYSEELDVPFTFPQVKPLFSSLRQPIKTSVPRRPLKRLKFLRLPELEDETPPLDENEKNDGSLSLNSLSGDLKSCLNIDSHSERNTKKDNNERPNLTPLKINLRTPFSAKSSCLVKRVPKYCPTPALKQNEENSYAKDKKFAQLAVDFEGISKSSGRQDKLGCESKGVNNGRILKDILNHGQNTKKPVDDVKITYNSRSTKNNDEKDVFIKPSVSLHPSCRKENKWLPSNESKEILEKPRQQQVFVKETRLEEKCNVINYNGDPSMFKKIDPSVLSVNNVQYQVLSKLGQGGSSQVYQVLDTKTSALLAVKCVNLSDADEETAKSYLKEIEKLLELQSSNRVIKLLDYEYLMQQQRLYVVMEKGDTDLSALLKDMTKSGDVSLAMIIYYWTEMLHSVKEIHSHGIVHADLKPANFLLVRGRLKLIDFGIASNIQTDATSVFKNSMHGTCNYMSPEAIQDPDNSSRTKVGYKSDVWSLGCILYNLLYRKTPFQHITNNMKKLQVIASPNHRIEFPPLEKCPPPLLNALKRCLTYDSKKRPTVAELLAVDVFVH